MTLREGVSTDTYELSHALCPPLPQLVSLDSGITCSQFKPQHPASCPLLLTYIK